MTEQRGHENNADGLHKIQNYNGRRSFEMQPLKTDGVQDEENYEENEMFANEPSIGTEGIVVTDHEIPDDNNNIKIERPWNLIDWLYPPHLPPELQLLRRENIAIPACYLLVGILQGLSGPLINVYPLDLNATEAQQTTISTLKSLPASLKLIFGFISDNFPIFGYRRKSYMFVGWAMSAAAFGSLLLTTDLTLSEDEYTKDDGEIGTKTIIPPNAPSIPFFSMMTFLFGAGKL